MYMYLPIYNQCKSVCVCVCVCVQFESAVCVSVCFKEIFVKEKIHKQIIFQIYLSQRCGKSVKSE